MRAIAFFLLFISTLAFADPTFSPWGPSYLVVNSTVQVTTLDGSQPTSYRIINLASANQCFSWGTTSASVPTPTAPTAGNPATRILCMLPLTAETFHGLPPNGYFQASAATGFYVTPGEGF